eukprot:g6282.t1
MHRMTRPISSGRLSGSVPYLLLNVPPVGILRRQSRPYHSPDANPLTFLRSFPELSPGIYVGVDPDLGGAIGVIDVQQKGNGLLCSALQVTDMPCSKVVINGKNRKRADPARVLEIVTELKKSSKSEHLWACLEEPSAFSYVGGLSTQQTGYLFGLCYGILLAHGFQIHTVRPCIWKKQLNLSSKKKDASRELAKQLFPESEQLLKRKKDHGRAEALLLAAYGAGFRLAKEEDAIPFETAILAPESCIAS